MTTKNVVGVNFLSTKSEDCTGEYWLEVVAVQAKRSEVSTKTTEGLFPHFAVISLPIELYG